MSRVYKSLALLALLALCSAACACGDTGLQQITVPLFAVGAAPASFDAGGWTVRLDQARVGIGPIYFCASAHSSAELCPSSVAEFTDSSAVDALDEKRVRIGTLDALTVNLRSAAWDFAITWPAKETAPVVLHGAPDGHSAHFEGSATKDDKQIDFVADIDATPSMRGTRVVYGVDTHASIVDGIECELHVDAAAWWSHVVFDDLSSKSDEPVTIEPGTRAYEALSLAMRNANSRPTVVWSE